MENTETKQENRQENKNENKPKFKIYEDQTKIQDFVEPEWMKILEKLLENRADCRAHQEYDKAE